ncbi:MAG: VOC family protein [Ilumatobacteraceae bacterium]|nr:VOC family protein [Ilumatobacteraceae bacterium]
MASVRAADILDRAGGIMHIRRIHHVAVAHGDDSPLIGALVDHAGLTVTETEYGEGFTERMWPVGASYVQTLEATGDGIIERSLTSRGPGLHHLAFEVDDVEAAVADLRDAGVRVIDEAPRRVGHTLVAFVHPSAFGGVLVELVEELPASDLN